jgi:CHAT domain-containing protein
MRCWSPSASRLPRDIAALAAALLAAAALAQAPEDAYGDEDAAPRIGAEEARRIMAQPLPSPDLPAAQQGEILVRRQQAAFALGDAPGRIAALERLVALTERKDQPSPWALPLWRELARTGNQTAALEMGERLAEDARFSPHARATTLAWLGDDYTVFGEIDKARRALARLEDIARRLPPSDDPLARDLPINLDHLRAAVMQADGDLEGAEGAIRRAVAAANAEVEGAKRLPAGRARELRHDATIRTRTGQMRRQVSILMAQGKHAEAEHVARLGLALAREEKTGGTMVGLWQARVALAKVGQRRYAEALAASREALDTLAAAGAAPSSDRVVFARLYQLQALFGLERWAEADQVMAGMRADAGEDRLARLLIDSPVLQAFLHLVNGRTEEALQRVEGSIRYRARQHGETHPSTIEAKAVRAMAFQAASRPREALQDYAEVFASIFGPDTSFADAEPAGLRGYILPHALRAYLRLTAASWRENGGKVSAEMASDAFRVADRLRASAVQQALVDSAARAVAANPELAALVRQEQDHRVRAREAMGQLARRIVEDARLTREAQERLKGKRDEGEARAERERARDRGLAIRAQREQFQAGEEARRELLRALRKRFPEYQALVNPKAPSIREAAALLQRDEALVSLFPAAEGTYAWAVAPGREAMLRVSGLKAAEVAALVARLRKTLDLGESPRPAAVAFDFAAAARLHAELLAPLAPAIGEAKSLVIVANGELAQVPLAVLVTREGAHEPAQAPWLVKQAALTQVSSVAAFQAIRQQRRAAGPSKPFAGFGDPAFRAAPPAQPGAVRALLKAPVAARSAGVDTADYEALPPLPETRTEIVAIARALGADPERDTWLGARATRQAALTADLADRRVVAFATHGLKPHDLPGLSRPALALAAAPGQSPLLVLDDVMTMKLDADLVVLSACNTASDDGSAEEALSGLARGFFFAGARSVLVTHWAVETVSAEQLVKRTFGHIAQSVPRAEALRRAQLELIDGKAGAAFRHPFYWAPYALSGDPGP